MRSSVSLGQPDRGIPAADELSEAVLDTLRRLRTLLPGGGEERAAQQEMALAVADVMARGGAIMVQAPTGTGKTLASLLPTVLSGRRAVVTTATHTLQSQIATKDLPLIRAVVGNHLTWSVVKGRQSYACLSAIDDALAEAERSGSDDPELARVASWAGLTATGERAELVPGVDAALWDRCSTPGTECPGARRCERGRHCFAEAARDRAASSQIVLATSRLYTAHLLVQRGVLPPHDALVIDECHELESDLEETFGLAIGPLRASRLLASAQRCGVCSPRSLTALGRAVEQFTEVVATDVALRFGEGGRANPLVGSLAGLSAAAGLVAADATGALAAGGAPKGVGRVARAAERLRDDAIKCAHPTDADVLRYVSVSASGNRVVRAVPTDLDRILSDRLWGRLPVVLCSADATAVLARRLGLPEQAFLRLGSPWDWRNQALLYVPQLPTPREGRVWEDAVCDRVQTMVAVAEGRSLVLATSVRMLHRLAAALREGGRHRVLVQGEGTRGALLRQFVDDEESVLVATKAFFTGVDAPGTTLSLVVVDRLPFPVPDDPLLQAKRSREGGGFAGVDLAETAVALNQAVGRLLRSSRDAGVVMVTDPRLVDTGYGKKLLAELPDMRRTRDEAEAVNFLRDVLARSI